MFGLLEPCTAPPALGAGEAEANALRLGFCGIDMMSDDKR